MKFINFATMDSPSEAEAVSRRLGEHGVAARAHDERDVQRFLFATKPKGFSIVQVDEGDYGKAAALLQEWEEENPQLASHIFRCPECASFAVEYPQFTRKVFITPVIVEWMSNLGLFEKQFYCRKCHATWPPGPASHLTPKTAMPQSVLVPPSD